MQIIFLTQGCTNPWHQVTHATRSCMVVPNISGAWYGTCFVPPFWHLELWAGF